MKTELKEKRTLTQKHFDNGDGTFSLQAHIGHIHYDNKLKKGDGVEGLRSIDTTLLWNEVRRGWEFEFHSFNPFIPEFADEWADFRDLFDKKDQTISYQPKCSHVAGRLVPSIEGLTDSNAVIYDNAFGEGFDLIYYFTRSQMLKVVRIRESFKPTEDVSFDFGVKFSDPTMKVLRTYDNGDEYELDISKPKKFDSARKTKIKKRVEVDGEKEPHTFLKEFKAWDSGQDTEEGTQTEIIEVDFIVDQTGVMFRKHITAAFLAKSVGDVFTDTTTSYYVGSGDGYTEPTDDGLNWDATHDDTAGNSANYTSATQKLRILWGGANVVIGRMFFPVDTSGIPDAATISDASFFVKIDEVSDEDNDAQGYWGLIGVTTQASTSSIVTADFDQCGSVDSPTEQSDTHIDNTGVSNASYSEFPLNATGLANVSKTGFTKFGIREGHDIEDVSITQTGGIENSANFSMSEAASGSDPYIEVTYTEGGAGQNSNFLAIM